MEEELPDINTLGSIRAMVFNNYILTEAIFEMLVDLKAKVEARDKAEVNAEVSDRLEFIRMRASEQFVDDFRLGEGDNYSPYAE